MPSNPYIEEMKIRKKLHELLQTIIEQKKEVQYWGLIHRILLSYPVSESWVHNYINNFYVRTKQLQIENDILKVVNSE